MQKKIRILCLFMVFTILAGMVPGMSLTAFAEGKSATDEFIALTDYTAASANWSPPSQDFELNGEKFYAVNDFKDNRWLQFDDVVFSGKEVSFSADFMHVSAATTFSFNVYVDGISTDNLIAQGVDLSSGNGWGGMTTFTVPLSKQVSAGSHNVIVEGLPLTVNDAEEWGTTLVAFYAFRFVEKEGQYATDETFATGYSTKNGDINTQAMTFNSKGVTGLTGIGRLVNNSWARYDGILFLGNERSFSIDYSVHSYENNVSYQGNFNVYLDEIKPENCILEARGLTTGTGWTDLKTLTFPLSKKISRGTHSVIIEGLPNTELQQDATWAKDAAGFYAFRFIEGATDLEVKLDPSKTSPFNDGIFEGFGTSLVWAANYIGKNESLTKETTRVLFSMDDDSLGLNIARYNIVGGDEPTHYIPQSEGGNKHNTRDDSWDMKGFMDADGTYHWDRDAYQRFFLEESIKQNPELIVEGFSNSPPYFMTVSGCTGGNETATEDNIKDYAAFADYLATVAKHFRDDWGITFRSLSPINEPASGYWQAYNNKQEGAQVNQGEAQSTMFVELDRAMKEQGIRDDIMISGAEETSINQTRDGLWKLSDDALAVLDQVNTHTYSGTDRTDLKDVTAELGKNLWMSETDGDWLTAGSGDMTAALGFSKQLIKDMNEMMPSAWVIWQAIEGMDYPDPKDETKGYWSTGAANVFSDDEIIFYKKFYAYGQFTRYIRPGYKIIGSSDDTLAAYDPESGTIVVVVVNASPDVRGLTVDMSDFEGVGSTARVIRTSGKTNGNENWAELSPITLSGKTLTATLKGNSITTFVVEPGAYAIEGTDSEGEKVSTALPFTPALNSADYYVAAFENGDESRMADVVMNGFSGTLPENQASDAYYGLKLMGFDKVSQSPVTEAFTANGTRFAPGTAWSFASLLAKGKLSVKAETPIAVLGQTVTFSAVSEEADAEDIVWSVTLSNGSETADASITEDGQFTATKGGDYLVKAASASNPSLSASKVYTVLGEGEYVTITSKMSGLVADSEDRKTANGTKLVQKKNEGYDTSLWSLSAVEGKKNVFTLQNRNSGKFLTASADATDIYITDEVTATDDAAQWELVPCDSRYYRLKNVKTGIYMVVNQYSMGENAQLVQDNWARGDNSLFEIKRYDGRVRTVK